MTGALHEFLIGQEREARFGVAMERVVRDMWTGLAALDRRFVEGLAAAPGVKGESFQFEIAPAFGVDEPPMVVFDEVSPMSGDDFRRLQRSALKQFLGVRTNSEQEVPMDEKEVLARFDSVDQITGGQAGAMDEVRIGFKALAATILESCPSTRSRNIALTHLEDSSHYAIKAITHGM